MNFGRPLMRTIRSQAMMPRRMEMSPSQRVKNGFMVMYALVAVLGAEDGDESECNKKAPRYN